MVNRLKFVFLLQMLINKYFFIKERVPNQEVQLIKNKKSLWTVLQ